MSIATFIPKIWSARLLEHLDKAHIFGALVNRDYEGEISAFGDTVIINQIGDITIKTYTKDTDIDAPQSLETADQMLIIDQAKYFNFGIDDIDKAQARTPLMDKAMARTAYGLADVNDLFIANLMKTEAGILVPSATITPTDAYDVLVEMKIKMDKENVPKTGRWIVVPPEFEGYMLLDPRFASAYGSQAEGRLVNGLVAKGAGFDIYVSNNTPGLIASNNMSTTYAQQITEVEAYRPEKSFKDAMKGLNVYGGKVTQPKSIAYMEATFGEPTIP